MKPSNFLRLVERPDKTNYLALAPDNLGLLDLLQKALAKHTAKPDIHFVDAESLTKEKTRLLEKEARYAPVGGSPLTQFVIHSLQRLPAGSTGPLLKAVEEAKYARFIFQAQFLPRKIRTLRSRAVICHIPFLTRKVVTGNLQAMSLDTKAVEEGNLYDGTLSGTARNIGTKDTLNAIRKELQRGTRGSASLMCKEMLGSLVFRTAIDDKLTSEERRFLDRNDTPERRKLVLAILAGRPG